MSEDEKDNISNLICKFHNNLMKITVTKYSDTAEELLDEIEEDYDICCDSGDWKDRYDGEIKRPSKSQFKEIHFYCDKKYGKGWVKTDGSEIDKVEEAIKELFPELIK